MSRAGGETALTASVPLPLVGQPLRVDGCGCGAALTTAVGTDVEVAEPALFVAFSRTRSVFPTSTCFSAYVEPVAPEMLEQLPPFWSQRRHWNDVEVGLLLHVPPCAVSVLPSTGVPLIVGGLWFDGGDPAARENPATTSTVTAPAARSASRLVFR